MALEQVINLDSKTKGGIIGISQRPGTLERWFLTAHERAAVTTATKELCGLRNIADGGIKHKEGCAGRIRRDEEDIKNLMNTLQSVMCNPFHGVGDDEERISLLNVSTGVVMPPAIAPRLLDAENIGRQETKAFINQRLNTCKVGFWDLLSK